MAFRFLDLYLYRNSFLCIFISVFALVSAAMENTTLIPAENLLAPIKNTTFEFPTAGSKNHGVLSGVPIPSLWPLIPIPLGLLVDNPNMIQTSSQKQLQFENSLLNAAAQGFPTNQPYFLPQIAGSFNMDQTRINQPNYPVYSSNSQVFDAPNSFQGAVQPPNGQEYFTAQFTNLPVFQNQQNMVNQIQNFQQAYGTGNQQNQQLPAAQQNFNGGYLGAPVSTEGATDSMLYNMVISGNAANTGGTMLNMNFNNPNANNAVNGGGVNYGVASGSGYASGSFGYNGNPGGTGNLGITDVYPGCQK